METTRLIINVQRYYGEKSYYKKETLLIGGEASVVSSAFLIPDTSIVNISYDIETTGNTIVEATLYDEVAIENDTAIWRVIEDGEIINTSVRAIRFTCTADAVVIVRAQ